MMCQDVMTGTVYLSTGPGKMSNRIDNRSATQSEPNMVNLFPALPLSLTMRLLPDWPLFSFAMTI